MLWRMPKRNSSLLASMALCFSLRTSSRFSFVIQKGLLSRPYFVALCCPTEWGRRRRASFALKLLREWSRHRRKLPRFYLETESAYVYTSGGRIYGDGEGLEKRLDNCVIHQRDRLRKGHSVTKWGTLWNFPCIQDISGRFSWPHRSITLNAWFGYLDRRSWHRSKVLLARRSLCLLWTCLKSRFSFWWRHCKPGRAIGVQTGCSLGNIFTSGLISER